MATRQNLCPNPACGTNATGWSGSGSPSRITSITGMPVTTGVNATTDGFVQTPAGVVSVGQVATVSFYIKNNTGSTIAGGKQVFIAYTRSAGGDTFPENFTTAALGVAGNVQRASFTTAAAPADSTGIYLIVDSLALNIEISAVLYEISPSLADYFDGDSANSVWDGAEDNSTSTFTDPASGVNPDGIAVPIALGSPIITLNGVTPSGVAVAISLGTPTIVTPEQPVLSTPTPGWYGLLDTYRLQQEFEYEERNTPPVACPNDGEPLEADSLGRLRCRFDGWIWNGVAR